MGAVDKLAADLLASASNLAKTSKLLNFSRCTPVFGAVLVWLVTSACPAHTQDIKRSNTRLDLAKDFLIKQELDVAEVEAKKALEFHAGNGEAHYVLGMIDFMRSFDTHKLLEIDQCLTGIDAEGLLQDKERSLGAADRHFADAVKLQPELSEAWASRGTVATLLGRYDDAISYYAQALTQPARLQNIGVVRANLGWAYFHKEDLVSATKELLQAVQFQPGMCVATYRLGRVYFARKEWEKALQQLREVAGSLGCPIQDAHLFIMKTYLELGVTEELPGVENSCVGMAPNSCVALQCRALGISPSDEVGPNFNQVRP